MHEPSFDNWTIIFLNFSFIGFLLFFFFWFKKSDNKIANRLIALYVLLYAIMMVEYVLFWTRYLKYFPHWADVSAAFPFAFGPLLYLYFKISYEKNKLTGKDLLHFLPLVFFLCLKSPFYLMDGVAKINGPYPFVFKNYWKIMHAMPWIKIGHNCIYIVLMVFYINRQNSIGQNKKWARALVFFFSLFVAGSVAYYTLILFPWFNVEWDYFISFIMSAAIICTAWFAFAYPGIFSGYNLMESIIDLKNTNLAWQKLHYIYESKNNRAHKKLPVNYSYNENNNGMVNSPDMEYQLAVEEETFIKYKNSGLTDAAGKELLLALQNCMQTEKLYRESEINLECLAKKLETTRHNLSQVINERIGLSFFDYINFLRIQEAKEIFKDIAKQKHTIIEIAYDVGFNNKVTFNAAFKKFTRQTPTEFRKNPR